MNYTLITGASRGIGKALAEECAKRRMNLLLVARSLPELVAIKDDLVEKYKVDVDCIQLDLTDAKAGFFLKEYIESNDLNINCLINNAGVGLYGEFYRSDIKSQRQLIQLNIAAIVDITYHVLPHLMKQPESFIMNVSSLSAFHAMPQMSAFAASKAFVKSFSDGLRQELKDDDIRVTVLCPGPVASNFTEIAGLEKYDENSMRWMQLTPEKVASSAVSGMLNGKRKVIPGVINKVGFYLITLLPEWVLSAMVKKIFLNKGK